MSQTTRRDIASSEKAHLLDLVEKQRQYRTGVIFGSRLSNYFYDSGTGKILRLGDMEYRLFKAIFNPAATVESVSQAFLSENKALIQDFLCNTSNLKLLRLPPIKSMDFCCPNHLSQQIDHELTQLVLEVTQRCNFRCKYCIYNDTYEGNHNFSNSDMSWETAKLSIDYLFSHSDGCENIYITFYGGEPLLNFELVKKCITYAQGLRKDRHLFFNLTTNLSLMTKEIADYFASIQGLSLTVSLDGPEKHNSCRVYAGGKESFPDAMRGMGYVCDAFSLAKKQLTISSVLTPPYDFEKLDEINSFFESIPNLPANTSIVITYPSKGTYDTGSYANSIYQNPRYWELGDFDPLGKWQLAQAIRHSLSWERTNNIYFRSLVDALVRIKNRFASSTPTLRSGCIEACCVPGVRKLYVHTDGNLSICERIGESPSIGNIRDGIDKQIISDIYIKDYLKKSQSMCADCWAFNVCPMCYALCFGSNGVELKNKATVCQTCRTSTYMNLAKYCTLVEECPDAIDVLDSARVL